MKGMEKKKGRGGGGGGVGEGITENLKINMLEH